MQRADYVWSRALGRKPSDVDVDAIQRACAAVDWPVENVADCEQSLNFYAIEAMSSLCSALDVCRNGSVLSAAQCAEFVLNKLDRQVSNELFVQSYSQAVWSDSKWSAELTRQGKMLELLQSGRGISAEEKSLFRE